MSEDAKTPETREALRKTHGLFRAAAETNGFASFARQLETQRDEARRERDGLHGLHNKNAVYRQELIDLCANLRADLRAKSERVNVLEKSLTEATDWIENSLAVEGHPVPASMSLLAGWRAALLSTPPASDNKDTTT